MKYIEWRDEFEHFLSGLDRDERDRILAYYSEMYADRRDSGMTEEEIVAGFGAPYDAAKKILDEEDAKKKSRSDEKNHVHDEERARFTSSGGVDALEINGALGNVFVRFYDGNCINVDYPATALLDYRVSQHGGKVVIKHKNIKFRNVNFKNGIIPDMTIDVPRGLTPDLEINLIGGSIKMDGGDYGKLKAYLEGGALNVGRINCGDADLATDAGKIEIEGVVCHRLHAEINAGKLQARSICGSTADINVNAGAACAGHVDCRRTRIRVSAGKADITLCGAKEDYDIDVKRTLGSCNIDGRAPGCDRSVIADVRFGSLNVSFAR